MLQVQVIGFIGADARLEESNGNKFVSFNVAHTDSWTDQNGNKHESTIWVSCALNGDRGNIAQYLVKGKQVYVQGRLSTRVYSSPKERKMVAGINCSVDRIELIGGKVDEVPSQLVAESGLLCRVNKAFYISQDDVKSIGIKKDAPATLMTPAGRLFDVDYKGWVMPKPEQTPELQQADNKDNNQADNNA